VKIIISHNQQYQDTRKIPQTMAIDIQSRELRSS
jgi:hypothetical protein